MMTSDLDLTYNLSSLSLVIGSNHIYLDYIMAIITSEKLCETLDIPKSCDNLIAIIEAKIVFFIGYLKDFKYY